MKEDGEDRREVRRLVLAISSLLQLVVWGYLGSAHFAGREAVYVVAMLVAALGTLALAVVEQAPRWSTVAGALAHAVALCAFVLINGVAGEGGEGLALLFASGLVVLLFLPAVVSACLALSIAGRRSEREA